MPEYDTFTKQNVSMNEYTIHTHVQELNVLNVPRILHYDENAHIMVMEKIHGQNLSDFYGEEAADVNPKIFAQVREIIKTLRNHNVTYIDITGYNFMLDNNEKLWIIDFEHSYPWI